MRFTLENLINSIAGQVKEIWPEIPVYSNPNQQGTKTPCFFIFFISFFYFFSSTVIISLAFSSAAIDK